jgi:prepilin-type N-terminal cleavage/methylation domain-containing protein
MRKFSHGFTIVELTVVIAVIGILSTIGVISFARYQSGSRDDQRASQVKIIQEALEKYYDANGEYPSCAMLTQSPSIVTASVLPGINTASLVTPTAAAGVTNSITCACLTQPSSGTNPAVCSGLGTTVSTDSFAYVGDGSPICETSIVNASCLQYTLQYREESTGNIIAINSRRQQNIQSSGNVADLSAAPFSFSQINLTFTGISGATSYNVRYATNAAMNSPTTATPIASSSTPVTGSVTGLSLGQQYWIQVQPATTSSVGGWSNIATTTTYTLNTPTGNVVANASTPASALDFTWNTVQNATSYNVQYAPNTCSGTFTTLTGITGAYPGNITRTISGLAAGTTLCFQVQALAPGYTSGWSTGASAVTQVPTPTCTASTLNSNTQVTVNWNTVGVATSYTLQYSSNSGFSGASTVSGITAGTTSNVVSGLNNGTIYYFQIEALVGSTPSSYGACPSATTGVDGPTGYGWSADGYAVRAASNGTWIAYPGAGSYHSEGMTIYGSCTAGATVITRLYAYYATASNTSPTGGALMDWTWNNQDRFFEGATSGYRVWWQGWVACESPSGTASASQPYLGNAGPYT